MNANLLKLVLGAGFTLTGISLLATGLRENESKPPSKSSQPPKKAVKKVAATPPKEKPPAKKEETPPVKKDEIPPAEEIPKEKVDDSEVIDNN